MPWLYYGSNEGETINKDTNLPTIYTKGSYLDIRVAKYSLEGTFIGYEPLNRSSLMMCEQSVDKTQHIFLIGREYKHSVS